MKQISDEAKERAKQNSRKSEEHGKTKVLRFTEWPISRRKKENIPFVIQTTILVQTSVTFQLKKINIEFF